MLRLIIFLITSIVLEKVACDDWQFSEELTPGFIFQWSYNESAIDMKLTGPTVGWIGIGFSISRTMTGSDLIIAGVQNGVPYAWDCYARRNGPPTIDARQNVEIIDGFENSTHTSVTVRRSLSVVDFNDNEITTGKNNVIWAFGDIDKGRESLMADYHGRNRGLKELIILRENVGKASGAFLTRLHRCSATDIDDKPSMTSDSSIPPSPSQETMTTATNKEHEDPKAIVSQAISRSSSQFTSTTTEKTKHQRSSPSSISPTKPKETPTNAPYYLGFPFTDILDQQELVQINWDFDDETITLQLIAPTTGWIGVGFSYTASMNNADLIMMGVNSKETYALDCHSDKNGVPEVDEDQNVEVVAGWENGTHTAVAIRRKRLTCNPDDMDITEGTYKVIWAYGAEDLNNDKPSFRYYHRRNRGGKSLKLINAISDDFRKQDIKREEKYRDIGPADFKVPPNSTFYLCKYAEVTKKDQLIYITGYEAYFTKGNEKNVHHITFYLCLGEPDTDQLQQNYSCYVDLHPFTVGCNKILAGWAVGNTGITYPENSGFPLGGDDHPTYVMVEMHYDNPDQREFLDSSGLRVHYVEQKPDNLIGLLDVSQTISTMWIPPGAERYRIGGYCTANCLSQAMENAGITDVPLIGVIFHSHLAGRGMRLRHFRNGTELEALARDEHYDFNYQEVQYFEEAKILQPGDSLTLECDYRTLDRKTVTPGGLPTTSEMCIAFLIYMSPLNISTCGSRAKLFEDPPTLFKLGAGLNISVSPSKMMEVGRKMTVNYWEAMEIFSTEILDQVDWNDEKRKFAQEFTDNLTLFTTCIDRSKNIVGFYEEFMAPKSGEYIDNSPICPTKKPSSTTKYSSSIMTSALVTVSVFILVLAAAKLLATKP